MINWTACHEYASAIANGTTPMVAKPADYDQAAARALELVVKLDAAEMEMEVLDAVDRFFG